VAAAAAAAAAVRRPARAANLSETDEERHLKVCALVAKGRLQQVGPDRRPLLRCRPAPACLDPC
jgi:hypothetical protein